MKATQEPKRFPYRPLHGSTIRILVISPQIESHGPVICKFEETSLDSNPWPAYEALSYVWGDSPITSTIRIQHGNIAYPFKVSKTLDSALRRLRNRNGERRLWVDALCINQKNPDERSAQVKRMRHIYHRASNVCVWLGEQSEDSDCVFHFIEGLLKQAMDQLEKKIQNPGNTRNWRALGAMMRRTWFSRRWCVQEIALARKATVYCGSKTIDWDDFADAVTLYEEQSEDIVRILTEHTRQEAHAKRWSSIEVQAIGAHSLIKMLDNLSRRTADGRLPECLLSIGTLVSILPSYDVTDPRDAIYAVLSLAKDTADNENAIAVDYTKPELQVYQDFIDFVIEKTRSLDIICTPWAPAKTRDKTSITLPSWIVPVYKRPFSQVDDGKHFQRQNADLLVGMEGWRTYSTGGDVKAGDWKILQSPLRLSVRGLEIGEIKHLEKPAQYGKVPLSWLRKVAVVENEQGAARGDKISSGQDIMKPQSNTNTQDRADPSGAATEAYPFIFDSLKTVRYNANTSATRDATESESDTFERSADRKCNSRNTPKTHEPAYIPDSFWRTLVADRGPDGKNPPRWYKRVCQKVFTRQDPKAHGVTVDYLATSQEIYNAMINSRKSVNRSAIGFLRRVQATTWNKRLMVSEAGSIGLAPEQAKIGDIICLLWGCSVPVILRQKGQFMELIGECYVHGIMNGELMYNHPGVDGLRNKHNRFFEII